MRRASKLLSLLLAISMILAMMPTFAGAVQYTGITYTSVGGTTVEYSDLGDAMSAAMADALATTKTGGVIKFYRDYTITASSKKLGVSSHGIYSGMSKAFTIDLDGHTLGMDKTFNDTHSGGYIMFQFPDNNSNGVIATYKNGTITHVGGRGVVAVSTSSKNDVSTTVNFDNMKIYKTDGNIYQTYSDVAVLNVVGGEMVGASTSTSAVSPLQLLKTTAGTGSGTINLSGGAQIMNITPNADKYPVSSGADAGVINIEDATLWCTINTAPIIRTACIHAASEPVISTTTTEKTWNGITRALYSFMYSSTAVKAASYTSVGGVTKDYSTFSAAFAASQADADATTTTVGTIKLLQDISLDPATEAGFGTQANFYFGDFTKGVTINLDGHKMTYAGEKNIFGILDCSAGLDVALTLKNGKIIHYGTNRCIVCFGANSGAVCNAAGEMFAPTVTFDNVEAYAKASAVVYSTYFATTVNVLNGCKLVNWSTTSSPINFGKSTTASTGTGVYAPTLNISGGSVLVGVNNYATTASGVGAKYNVGDAYVGASASKASYGNVNALSGTWVYGGKNDTVSQSVTYCDTPTTTASATVNMTQFVAGYTISWDTDGDGTVDDTTAAAPNAVPTHADGSKPMDSDWIYTFTGWNPTIAAATADVTYTAQFSKAPNTLPEYTISWDTNGDGVVDDTTSVKQGVMPTHADGSKPDSGSTAYTFTGWNPSIVVAAAAATYTAQFSAGPAYAATYTSYDGNSVTNHNTFTSAFAAAQSDTSADQAKPGTITLLRDIDLGDGSGAESGYAANASMLFNNYNNGIIVDLNNHKLIYRGVQNMFAITTKAYTQTTFKNGTIIHDGTQRSVIVFGTSTGNVTTSSGTLISPTVTFDNVDAYLTDNNTNGCLVNSYFYGTKIFVKNGSKLVSTKVNSINFAMTSTANSTGATYAPTLTLSDDSVIAAMGNYPLGASAVGCVMNLNNGRLYYADGKNYGTSKVLGSTINAESISTPTTESVTYYADADTTATANANMVACRPLYTISWDTDGDGTVDGTTDVAHGQMPTHADGKKDMDENWIYTFTGWSPALTSATANATYTAQFSKVPNTSTTYTISWDTDADGVVDDTTTVIENMMPQHENGSKATDDQFVYTFTGWNPAVVKAAADVTYTAVFSKTPVKVISWDTDGDGTVDDTTYVAPSATPTHADGVKAKDEQFMYTFTGWDPAIVAASADVTYTAQFTASSRYAATYTIADGSATDKYETFSEAFAAAQVDGTASQTKAGTIKLLRDVDLGNGSGAETGYAAAYNHLFNNFDKAITVDFDGYSMSYNGDQNIFAITSKVGTQITLKNGTIYYFGTSRCIVTFGTTTGNVFSSTGNMLSPKLTLDHMNAYMLSGTSAVVASNLFGTEINVIGGRVINASTGVAIALDRSSQTSANYSGTGSFAPVLNVTEGAEIGSCGNFAFRGVPGAIFNLTRAKAYYNAGSSTGDFGNSATMTCTFTGRATAPTTEDMTYPTSATATATISRACKSFSPTYSISWDTDGDGTADDTTTVVEGETPTHADGVKPIDAQYSYQFTGWSPAPVAADGEATYTAQFVAVPHVIPHYEISWDVNGDGTVDETEVLERGTMPAHADGTKEPDVNGVYRFVGWNPTISEVNATTVYTATFEKTDDVAGVKLGDSAETYFTTLQAAANFASTQAGSTITLYGDVVMDDPSEEATITAATVLDLNTHQICYTGDYFALTVNATGDVVVKNGTILTAGSGNGIREDSGNLTLDSLEITAAGTALLITGASSQNILNDVNLNGSTSGSDICYALQIADSAAASQTILRHVEIMTAAVSPSISIAPNLGKVVNFESGNIYVPQEFYEASGAWAYGQDSVTSALSKVSRYSYRYTVDNSYAGTTHADNYYLNTAIAAVATVGSTSYGTFTEAINAAKKAPGSTITLYSDVDLRDEYPTYTPTSNYMFYLTCNMTVDLNGHTIRGINDVGLFYAGTANTVITFKNGSVILPDVGMGSYCKYTFCATNSSTLNLKNVNVTSGRSCVYFTSSATDTTYINIDGGTFIGNTSGSTYVAVGGTTIASGAYPTYTITGGATFISGTSASSGYTGLGAQVGNYVIDDAVVYVESSAVNAVNATHLADGVAEYQDAGTVALTYGVRDSNYKVYRYTAAPAAKIGTQVYPALAAAIAAARVGDTIELTSNAKLSTAETLASGITLALGDYSLSFGAQGKLDVYGTVTYGKGKVYSGREMKLYADARFGAVTVPDGATYVLDGGLDMQKYSISLNSTISGNLKFSAASMAEYDSAVVSAKTVMGTMNLSRTSVSGSYDVFSVSGILANQFGEEAVVMAMATKTGETVTYIGTPATVSVKSYAKRVLESAEYGPTSNLGLTMIALLNYGAAAQRYMNTIVSPSQLVNYDVPECTTYGTDIAANWSDAGVYGAAGILSVVPNIVNGTQLSVRVDSTRTTAEVASLKVTVEGKDLYGNDISATVLGSELRTNDGTTYSATFYGVHAGDIRSSLTIKLYDGDTLLDTGADSFASAAYRAKTTNSNPYVGDACTKAVIFGDAANKYFSES